MNILVNGHKIFVYNVKLFHKLFPTVSENYSDRYQYTIEFDGYRLSDPEIIKTIINDLIDGAHMYQYVEEPSKWDEPEDIRHLMAIYKFIDMYIFPEDSGLSNHMDHLKELIVCRINERLYTTISMCEYLTYGPWHIIDDPNCDRQESILSLLLTKLEVQDDYTLIHLKDIDNSSPSTINKIKSFISSVTEKKTPILIGGVLYTSLTGRSQKWYDYKSNPLIDRQHVIYKRLQKAFRKLVSKGNNPLRDSKLGDEFVSYAQHFRIDDHVISILFDDIIVPDFSPELMKKMIISQKRMYIYWKYIYNLEITMTSIYTHWVVLGAEKDINDPLLEPPKITIVDA